MIDHARQQAVRATADGNPIYPLPAFCSHLHAESMRVLHATHQLKMQSSALAHPHSSNLTGSSVADDDGGLEMESGEVEDEDLPDMAGGDGDDGDSDSGSASTSGFDGDLAAQDDDRTGAPSLHALMRRQ